MRNSIDNITRLKRLSEEYIRIFSQPGVEFRSTSLSRMSDCGTRLSYWCQETPNGLERVKLHKANFCRERFCPLCASRKSSKNSYILSSVCDELKSEGYYFSFITLTLKSLPLYHSQEQLNHLFYAFNLFRQRVSFKSRYDGYFRSLEFTFNRDSTGLIWVHPHIHMIACYSRSKRINGAGYYPQFELVNEWRTALQLPADSPCICDIREIKLDKNHKSLQELSKYCFDFSDVLDIFKTSSVNEINDIISLVRSRQTYYYGGIFSTKKSHFVESEFTEDIPDDAILIQYEYDKVLKMYVISTNNVYLSNSIYSPRPFVLPELQLRC